MKMIFLFIDGFGIGGDDPGKNPFLAGRTPNLDSLFKNHIMIPTDSTLGITGLPQSATGQTTIFTGVNAPAALGRHMSGQPTVTLKKIIYRNNMFKELLQRGFKVTNTNVYMPNYLAQMLDPKDRKHRPSTTSLVTMAAGLPFRTVEDYNAGNGVYHDITGQIILDHGYEGRLITPAEAADRLYRISRDYDFTLFEHFMTDLIGHKMDMDLAVSQLELLDSLMGELLKKLDLKKDILFITSDHGNIEDVSVKTHTYNKVPTVIAGALPQGVELKIESLMDIMPTVLEIFKAHKR